MHTFKMSLNRGWIEAGLFIQDSLVKKVLLSSRNLLSSNLSRWSG